MYIHSADFALLLQLVTLAAIFFNQKVQEELLGQSALSVSKFEEPLLSLQLGNSHSFSSAEAVFTSAAELPD